MSDVREFNTRPVGSPGAESPLAWSYQRQGTPPREAKPGVTLREKAFLGHLVLRVVQLDEAFLEAAAQRGGRRERGRTAGQREQHHSSSSGSTGWMAADSPALRSPCSTCSATGCSHVPILAL